MFLRRSNRSRVKVKNLNSVSSKTETSDSQTDVKDSHGTQDSLELNITNPGQIFNDKEILDKNADA